MNTKILRSILALLSMLASSLCLLAACSQEPDPATPSGVAKANSSRPIVIENFSLGTRLGPHGGIATGAGERMFEAGQIIYVAMELTHAPVGTAVHVIWKAKGDIVLAEETKEVRKGQRFMYFAADGSSLPVDPQYRVEVFVDGKQLAELEFGLVLASA